MATRIKAMPIGHFGVDRIRECFGTVFIRVAAVWTAMENRRAAGRYLAGADARALSDIGLTAGDVDAAFSAPLWRDPTDHLARVKRDAAAARRG